MKEFDIDPDIVVKIGDNCFVLDTKWKKLGVDGKPGQDDLYQMYVYSARMNSKKTVLIYPMCYSYNVSKTYEEDIFGRKIIISTWFVNFDNIDNSLEEMISDFDNY